MKSTRSLAGLVVFVLAGFALIHIVPICKSDATNLAFVIVTCWPQIYDPNPDTRMELLNIDTENLRQMHELWNDDK